MDIMYIMLNLSNPFYIYIPNSKYTNWYPTPNAHYNLFESESFSEVETHALSYMCLFM
jgi:hypothetical protein